MLIERDFLKGFIFSLGIYTFAANFEDRQTNMTNNTRYDRNIISLKACVC